MTETLDLAFSFSLSAKIDINFDAHLQTRQQQIGLFVGMFLAQDLLTNAKSLKQLINFTIDILEGYADRPYHSAHHAIDVAYITYYLLMDMNIQQHVSLNTQEICVLLLSALGHDVLHSGRNNSFENNLKSNVSKLYNGFSVLENQSSTFVKHTILKYDLLNNLEFRKLRYNISDFDPAEDNESSVSILISDGTKTNISGDTQQPTTNHVYEQMLNSIHECILKTDMIHHFSLLNTLVQFYGGVDDDEDETSKRMYSNSSSSNLLHFQLRTSKMRQDMLNIILHAADISNPTRPFKISKKWSDLVLAEFRSQAETELILGLPLSFPNTIYNQPRTQIQFTNIIVKPFFDALCDLFPSIITMLDHITANAKDWELLSLEESKNEQKPSNKTEHAPDVDISEHKNVSLISGTIEISESLEKYLEGIDYQTARPTINQYGARKFSLAKTMLKAFSRTLGHSSESSFKGLDHSGGVIGNLVGSHQPSTTSSQTSELDMNYGIAKTSITSDLNLNSNTEQVVINEDEEI
jgi:hypothetical protein